MTAKLSCETDFTDFLTTAHCLGLGLVVLDCLKGLEVWHTIPWVYLPESTQAGELGLSTSFLYMARDTLPNKVRAVYSTFSFQRIFVGENLRSETGLWQQDT